MFPGDCTRSSLDPSGKTPLLLACYNDKTEIAQFLLEEEKRRKGAPTPVEQHAQVGEIPSYNMATTLGERPAFVGRKKSASLVESFLEFDDLHVANDADDGETILWHCANRGIVSDKIVQDERVRAQIGSRVHGKLPIEEGVLSCFMIDCPSFHVVMFQYLRGEFGAAATAHPAIRKRDLDSSWAIKHPSERWSVPSKTAHLTSKQ